MPQPFCVMLLSGWPGGPQATLTLHVYQVYIIIKDIQNWVQPNNTIFCSGFWQCVSFINGGNKCVEVRKDSLSFWWITFKTFGQMQKMHCSWKYWLLVDIWYLKHENLSLNPVQNVWFGQWHQPNLDGFC